MVESTDTLFQIENLSKAQVVAGVERSWSATDIRQRPTELVQVEQIDGTFCVSSILSEALRAVIEYAADMDSDLD